MPRKSSSAPKRRKHATAATPRMLSEAEKHELIRLHVANRAPQDPLQRLSLWAGVSLCVTVLLVGWWFTVGVGVQQAVSTEDAEELRALTEELDRFTEQVETNPLLNPPTVAPSTTSEATASGFDDILKENLGLDSPATRTQDLLVPRQPENVPPPTPVTPPGLTPDSETL
jgi:hypothetical protein